MALLAFVGVLCLSVPHWSPQIRSARVTFNDQPSPQSAVYRAGGGLLLLCLREPTTEAYGGRFYTLDPARHQAASPNRPNFLVLPGLVFVRHFDQQYGVLLGTAKTEVDPKVVVGPNFFEFTTLSHGRARVTY